MADNNLDNVKATITGSTLEYLPRATNQRNWHEMIYLGRLVWRTAWICVTFTHTPDTLHHNQTYY